MGGSGVLRYFQEGLEPTVRDLLTAMIVVSDNSATDLLLARIGGVAELNAWLAASGYPQTRMAQSVLDAVDSRTCSRTRGTRRSRAPRSTRCEPAIRSGPE